MTALTLAKDMLAAAGIADRMDWYNRKSDGTLLTGYLLDPAEVARIYAAGAAGVHLGDEGLREALEWYAGGDDGQRARDALAARPTEGDSR